MTDKVCPICGRNFIFSSFYKVCSLKCKRIYEENYYWAHRQKKLEYGKNYYWKTKEKNQNENH